MQHHLHPDSGQQHKPYYRDLGEYGEFGLLKDSDKVEMVLMSLNLAPFIASFEMHTGHDF